jgi:hypothetical protein
MVHKLLAKPTKEETMCHVLSTQEGPGFTCEDVDLLRWNFEETKVIEAKGKSDKERAQHDKDTDFGGRVSEHMDNDLLGARADWRDEE